MFVRSAMLLASANAWVRFVVKNKANPAVAGLTLAKRQKKLSAMYKATKQSK